MLEKDTALSTLQQTVSETAKFSVLGWSMVLLFITLNIFGAFLLKGEIQKLGCWNFVSPRSFLLFFMNLFSSWKVWIALMFLLSSTAVWSIALSSLELSKAYPVAIGLNFLATMAISIYFYGELITAFKIIGVGLIFFGIFFISR